MSLYTSFECNARLEHVVAHAGSPLPRCLPEAGAAVHAQPDGEPGPVPAGFLDRGDIEALPGAA